MQPAIPAPTAPHPATTAVLIGLESVGKSALFRNLTGEATGDETNFRGSTVRVRRGDVNDAALRVVDTPGIHARSDSATARLALRELAAADIVVLVVRSTHADAELRMLQAELGAMLRGKRTILVLTFEDKLTPELRQAALSQMPDMGIPCVWVNARQMTAMQHAQLLATLHAAAPLETTELSAFFVSRSVVPPIAPRRTPFENRRWGPWWALLAMLLLFALPVYLAYGLAQWLQPLVDRIILEPLLVGMAPWQARWPLLHAMLVGDYGVVTLGWYSFLWAFPVVALVAVSVAITEETGLKDRITAALDPWLRVIGLNGRDLIPVLSGFGCNVVAVFQSRACSSCTRGACVSLITFGAACSYQIGASLSLFNSAGAPWLFAPYLLVVGGVGAIYTRLWHGGLADAAARPLAERAFLQPPTLRGIWWRVRAVVAQFLQQAMPIFLLICAVGALLQYTGALAWMAHALGPVMALLGLPAEVAPGVLFSIVRKDGLLVLNQGQGALLQSMSAAQVFVLVYLASTLTACLVTLWTVRAELGGRYALTLAARQAAVSLASTLLLALLLLHI